ncbi:MAG: tetratricopeptide repeat protein, partial [Planctomycetales bacterium]
MPFSGWRNAAPEAISACRDLTRQGQVAAEQGKWESAERLFEQATAACPENPDAQRGHAEALWRRGQQQQALSVLDGAVRAAPDDASLHLMVAEMSYAAGDMSAGAHAVREAIELDPSLPAAWRLR